MYTLGFDAGIMDWLNEDSRPMSLSSNPRSLLRTVREVFELGQ